MHRFIGIIADVMQFLEAASIIGAFLSFGMWVNTFLDGHSYHESFGIFSGVFVAVAYALKQVRARWTSHH